MSIGATTETTPSGGRIASPRFARTLPQAYRICSDGPERMHPTEEEVAESMVQYTVRPKGLPQPLGKYSHISVAPASELVAIAGQLGVQEDGELPGDGGFAAQAHQAFHNIMVALKEASCTPADVLKFTTYLRYEDDIQRFMEARNEVFADMYPDGIYPPNTLLIVQRLVEDRFHLEIEALAVR